jgi:hypothetical protein
VVHADRAAVVTGSPGRWAWPTRGAAWIDPACWLLRLMVGGHSAAEAEARGVRIHAYAAADPAHFDVFVRANVSMWTRSSN